MSARFSFGNFILGGALLLSATMSAGAHDIDRTKLPLGDGKISDGPKAGWIWACHILPDAGGAFKDGPWIDQKSKTWDATRKTIVQGSVNWRSQFSISLSAGSRTVATIDLPDHPTGTFPIARSDPAYQYDRNPNSIRKQDVRFELPVMPKLAKEPTCAPPTVGILLTGVLLFNALDAPGRDAVAHETQDLCQGHPQAGGYYHYHSLTSCLPDKREANGHSSLVGYALDGFGIFGRYGDGGKELTSSDLDGCHGHTHVIPWDGMAVEMYHFHATQDFPYTVGCMRGTVEQVTLKSVMGQPKQRPRRK